MTTLDASLGVPHAPAPSLPDIIARERRRKLHRRLIWLGLGLFLLAAAAAAAITLRPRPLPIGARYRTQALSSGDVAHEVHASGHLEALSTVAVGSEISGRIVTVEADFNDAVKAGQVLARFDRATLELQLTQTKGALLAGQATLEQAASDRDHARSNLQRSQRLHASGKLSDAELDNATAASLSAEARARAAAAQIDVLRAAYNIARTNLERSVIRSPIDGLVITRNVDPGQTVVSMLQTPVLFTVAADLRHIRVVAAVDEADIGLVIPGQHASFTVTAHPERVFSGVVTEVRSSPVIVQDVVTYGTVIEVDNQDLALKPGMTAMVLIRTAEAKAVLRAPAAALRFLPPGETRPEAPGLWRLDGERLMRVTVETGVSDGIWTEIRSNVLTPDAQVLVELTPEGRKAHVDGR